MFWKIFFGNKFGFILETCLFSYLGQFIHTAQVSWNREIIEKEYVWIE